MKPTKLIIKNVGPIEDTTMVLKEPLILIFGDIQQGKSTVLKAIKWLFGGEFPQDIIRHGAQEASVDLEFDNGVIGKSWYRNKKGETVARDISWIRDGKMVKKPATELARLLNPFLLDQDYLIKMTERQRKQYFVELFALETDTKDLDTEAFHAAREAESLRSKIKGYGDIDLTAVPPDNKAELYQKLAEARRQHLEIPNSANREIEELQTQHSRKVQEIANQNLEVKEHNEKRSRLSARIGETEKQVAELEQKLVTLKATLAANQTEFAAMPAKTYVEVPPAPGRIEELRALVTAHPYTNSSIQALEGQLMEAAANDARREQFARNQERAKQRTADEDRLSVLEKRQREIKVEKLAKLQEISAKCPIPEMTFDESGTVFFEKTDSGMLSTSQLMRLSSALSALSPEGLGLELIDRAESLGKSIYEFIDRAKQNETTIMATIVGEAPAKAPEQVGVFVAEAGKVTKQEGQLL